MNPSIEETCEILKKLFQNPSSMKSKQVSDGILYYHTGEQTPYYYAKAYSLPRLERREEVAVESLVNIMTTQDLYIATQDSEMIITMHGDQLKNLFTVARSIGSDNIRVRLFHTQKEKYTTSVMEWSASGSFGEFYVRYLSQYEEDENNSNRIRTIDTPAITLSSPDLELYFGEPVWIKTLECSDLNATERGRIVHLYLGKNVCRWK